MAQLSVDHLALPIFDVPASFEFYSKLLELPLAGALSGDDWDGKPWLMMMFELAEGRQLVLVALRGASAEPSVLPRETRHFAFSVASEAELSRWEHKLREAGVTAWNEDHGPQRSLYFEDPNGIVLEITTPASRDLPAATASNARALVEAFIAETRGASPA